MLKPNFFLLGAPKCGTSAMRSYLANHPNVFITTPDEPGYFDSRFRFVHKTQYPFKNEAEYLHLYKNCQGQHKIRGEGSVYMLYSKEIIKSILSMCPDSKFLIMLRNPIHATISMHGENLKSPLIGREPKVNIDEAWRDQKRREALLELSGVHPLTFQYSKLFCYSKYIQDIFYLVPKNRVKIILYDDFIKNNIKTFHDVCMFLDISREYTPTIKTVNPRSQAKVNILTKSIGMAALIGKRLPLLKKLRGRGLMVNRFTQRPLRKPILQPDTYISMKNHFTQDIIQLEVLLNRDLSCWYK